MKKTSLAIIFACCALAMVAQDAIKVKYQGAKPTISDFVSSYLSIAALDDDECVNEADNAFNQAWIKHLKGQKLDKGETLTIDNKNGYVCYESRYEQHMLRIEMCYWNEADGKHKLVAHNVLSFRNGVYETGQFDGIFFYRYNNATKKMSMYSVPNFDAIHNYMGEGTCVFFGLPRTGKNITVNYMNYETKKVQSKIFKWTGSRFKF